MAAKQHCLDAYGIETSGTVIDVSFRSLTDVSYRTYSPHNKSEWQTIIYEFTTRKGATIRAKLYRPVHELSGLRDPFTVVYWERFPTVNSPRGAQRNPGAIVLAPLFLLIGIHFACLSRRMVNWRRDLLVASKRDVASN